MGPLATAGLGMTALTVFALGLRHGADPDHLAAIDNLTRNCSAKRHPMTRFVGTLFAGGHAIAVLAIAMLAGLLGSRIGPGGAVLETIGTWTSIVVLFAMAALNVQQLRKGARFKGLRTSLLPAALRSSNDPLAAVPVGLLFGLGFDTASQIAAYALALASGSGIAGAALIGVSFSLGMAVSDTLDSVLVGALCSRTCSTAAARVWIGAVSGAALLIGALELAQVLGWQPPFGSLAASGILVGALLCVFAWTVWRLGGADRQAAVSAGGTP